MEKYQRKKKGRPRRRHVRARPVVNDMVTIFAVTAVDFCNMPKCSETVTYTKNIDIHNSRGSLSLLQKQDAAATQSWEYK